MGAEAIFQELQEGGTISAIKLKSAIDGIQAWVYISECLVRVVAEEEPRKLGPPDFQALFKGELNKWGKLRPGKVDEVVGKRPFVNSFKAAVQTTRDVLDSKEDALKTLR